MEYKGLIQLGHDKPKIEKAKKLYVFVHPDLVREAGTQPEKQNFLEGQQRLDELFESYDGPILTLEEHDTLERKVSESSWLKESTRGLRYFLPTNFMSPLPIHGWDNCYSILDAFSPEEIRVGGVELSSLENGKYGMCVGVTYEGLKSRFGDRVILDLKICHSRDGRNTINED